MSECIFCQIIDGQIPAAKVYEDEHVFAFLDLSQVTKGHTLVIPKAHTENIFEMDSDMAGKLFASVPKIANALKAELKPKGMNLLNNNGAFADQSIMHFHLHLIPRYDETDGYSSEWVTHDTEYTKEKLGQIAQSIANRIQS